MRIPSLLAIALLTTITARAGAQSIAASQGEHPAASCVDSIPKSSLVRVPVFAALAMMEPSDAPVPPVAANVLQAVVDRVETMLGATPGKIPQGEPGIQWDSVGRGVLIDWRRDGRIRWRIQDNFDVGSPLPDRVARLVTSALDSAQVAGEVFMPWPESFNKDSVQMLIYFPRPMIDEAGTVQPIEARVAVPLFTVAAPRQKPIAIQRRPPAPHYPADMLSSGIEGKVTLRFVVDTMGRADTSTFRDLWPRDEPRLEGEQAAYYAELVERAKATVLKARFSPAEVGGCKVRQIVQQPFTWLIR